MHTSQVPRSPPGPKYAILTVNPCPRPQRHPDDTMWASATSEAHDTIFASATPNSTPSVAGSPMAVPGRLARIYVPATDSVDNQSAPRLLKVRWPCLCGKRNTRIAIHVPLSILTADLQVFLFPRRGTTSKRGPCVGGASRYARYSSTGRIRLTEDHTGVWGRTTSAITSGKCR